MAYKFVTEKQNYEDLSSGRVLYSAPGTTAFPVRLASDMFLQGKSYLQRNGGQGKYTLYDPCCGGAYLLTTVGLLHGEEVERIIGADIDPAVLEAARRNLSLLHTEGLTYRIDQLRKLYDSFGKASHKEAIESALRLQELVRQRNAPIAVDCFRASATERNDDFGCDGKIDFVMTDVPYGDRVQWETDRANPVEAMLDNLLDRLGPTSVVAIVAEKSQTVGHARYERLERYKIGKRQVVFLQPR